MREEPLPAEPLPEDVRVQAVQPEAVLGGGGPTHAREALRGSPVEVLLRDEFLEEGQAAGACGPLRRPLAGGELRAPATTRLNACKLIASFLIKLIINMYVRNLCMHRPL